ncbi:MAG TPA: glycoside hydrolase family 57 protein [Thermoanaerobaculia bacterium]|jgi:alpha-amylase
MIPICLYFQVHQPYRLRRYNYFDVGREHRYFDEPANTELLRRAARKCYLPATQMLARLLEAHPSFAVSLSLSGCLIEQLAEWEPDALAAFRNLTESSGGRVELLAETSHHSLAWLASRDEFAAQVDAHRALLGEALGYSTPPRVFRNTELIYSDALAAWLEERGFAGVLADGVQQLLGPDASHSHPHHLYRAATPAGLPLLLRDARLSDDIAFRFSQRAWSEWPLTAEKYDRWVSGLSGEILSLFMDFETFGEHQWRETGIFEFFEEWVGRASGRGASFWTPSQAIARLEPRETLSAPRPISWADEARDLSAWQGNDLQTDALRRLFALESRVRDAASDELRRDFRRLSTSDHFYYMATASTGSHGRGLSSADAEVHAYFSPYESPYEAYIAYMHVLSDLERRLRHGRTETAAVESPAARRPAPPVPA